MPNLTVSKLRSYAREAASLRFGLRSLRAVVLAVGLAITAAPRAVVTDATAAEAKPLPDITFTDVSGGSRSLASFRGKFVLLNVWATWCLPCRQEMPALDRLQSRLGGNDFEVVALSIDRRGIDTIQAFLAQNEITRLAVYNDAAGAAKNALGVFGIPTTLLVDREGREAQRWIGPIEWDSPEIVAAIGARLTADPAEPQQ